MWWRTNSVIEDLQLLKKLQQQKLALALWIRHRWIPPSRPPQCSLQQGYLPCPSLLKCFNSAREPLPALPISQGSLTWCPSARPGGSYSRIPLPCTAVLWARCRACGGKCIGRTWLTTNRVWPLLCPRPKLGAAEAKMEYEGPVYN